MPYAYVVYTILIALNLECGFSSSFSVLRRNEKNEELTEKGHCVWSVSYAVCSKRPKEIVHQVNVFV